MQIHVDAQWQAPGGGMRGYGVTFEEGDIAKVVQGGRSRAQAIQELSLTGEALVVTYVHSQDGIGAETYRARMAELKAKRGG